jgi:oxaloacetate decarboxylase alpha subunit
MSTQKAKKVGITEVVLRDAHQSLLATRMRTEDMLSVANELDRIGYWSIECWGGATFDSCIRFLREDPWERIRLLKKAMPNTKLQMLLRGQNLLGYRHYGDDVVDAFVERAATNGVDVFRIFDALNDTRNLARAITAVKQASRHAQGTISYTTSPFHTLVRFVELGRELEQMGCDSICIKDMAGLLTPSKATELVSGLKSNVRIPIQLHSHATTGLASTTLYAAVEAGCDNIDTAISALSLGSSHPPTESLVAMLAGTPRDTGLRLDLLQDIANRFIKIRSDYSEYESSLAAVDTRILAAQVPGGMLTNMESQLRQQGALDKLAEVLEEIPRVRKDLGYPPLVTPTSQIVGTQAVLNVLQGERYKTITAETKGLLAGRYGRTPTEVDKEVQKKALGDEEAITCRPADLIEPELDKLQKELGGDAPLEDVLTYALFPKVAKEFFKIRDSGEKPAEAKGTASKRIDANAPATSRGASAAYTVTVDGVSYNVTVQEGKGGTPVVSYRQQHETTHAEARGVPEAGATPVDAPLAGRVLRMVAKEGARISPGDTVMIIEAMKMETEIKASLSGTLARFFVSEGNEFAVGQPLYAVREG